MDLISMSELSALVQVILVDLVLAGDNAIVIGMAVVGLPAHLRGRVLVLGIAAATGLRVVFALLTVYLLQIIGLLLAGGILLLWVSWKLCGSCGSVATAAGGPQFKAMADGEPVEGVQARLSRCFRSHADHRCRCLDVIG